MGKKPTSGDVLQGTCPGEKGGIRRRTFCSLRLWSVDPLIDQQCGARTELSAHRPTDLGKNNRCSELPRQPGRKGRMPQGSEATRESLWLSEHFCPQGIFRFLPGSRQGPLKWSRRCQRGRGTGEQDTVQSCRGDQDGVQPPVLGCAPSLRVGSGGGDSKNEIWPQITPAFAGMEVAWLCTNSCQKERKVLRRKSLPES